MKPSRCIDTRRRGEHLTVRRYEREDGVRFTTWEVPATVLKGFGVQKVQAALDTYSRGEARRQAAAERKAEVAKRAGWKALAVAHDLGITEARVRQIRRELAGQADTQGRAKPEGGDNERDG